MQEGSITLLKIVLVQLVLRSNLSWWALSDKRYFALLYAQNKIMEHMI
jgi:hypothetical protein